MKIRLSHPISNVFCVALAEHLAEIGSLDTFWTSLGWDENAKWLERLPSSLTNQLRRRALASHLNPYLKTKPTREIMRLFSAASGLRFLYQKESAVFSVDRVFRSLDQWVAGNLHTLADGSVLYAYEDGALASFQRAKDLGIHCAYDLPIAHWKLRKTLYEAEAERYPEWAETIRGLSDSNAKLERKSQETRLADCIICPSRFVAESIPKEESSPNRVHIVPFGSPPSQPGNYRINEETHPLSVLFVASLSQRKGLADIFSAFKTIPKGSAKLSIIGSLQKPIEFYRQQYSGFDYLGTMPRARVLEQMRSADVLVLPSLAEGRALVIQEALSQGLPCIITPNTGADDLIDEGKNGFVVPIRRPDVLAEKLQWFCENRSVIPEMKNLASKGVEHFTWKRYGKAIYDILLRLDVPKTTA
jgi:glycosyltransferase involved in cell wall biosynthesis